MKKLAALLICLSFATVANATTLLQENFDDANVASRGWYDNTTINITTADHAPGSTACAAYTFNAGGTTPTSGGAMRHQFTASPTIYVSYWIKYSSNWQDQVGGAGHHELYMLTNLAAQYTNLAFTNTTTYLESWGTAGQTISLAPHMSFQDGANVNQSEINVDLTQTTENRSTDGCNGVLDPQYSTACYNSGNGTYWNGKHIPGPSGSITLGTWHHVEAYYKLNSIVNNKGVADGVIEYWLDGQLLMNHNDLLMRTAQYPNMAFNQFVIGPFMGNGAPANQTMYIDSLQIADSLPSSSAIPAAPTGLTAK